jgi:hypothetical protein
VGGTYTLEVVGPPPALPTPSAQFDGWTNEYTGNGNYVECGPTINGGCSGPRRTEACTGYDLSGAYVSLTWNVTPPSGVAWAVTSSPEPHLEPITSTTIVSGPKKAQAALGTLPFGLDAKRACSSLTVTDLRTGKQASADVCHDVEADRTSIINELAACSTPPTEALRGQWCAARTARGLECGTTPSVPNDTVPDRTPEGPTSTNAATDDSSHEASGCELTRRSSSGPTALVLSLAALGVAVLRRRANKLAAAPPSGPSPTGPVATKRTLQSPLVG